MSDIHSFTSIIDLLGGPSELARELNCGASRVANMHSRDSIPAPYFVDVVQIAAKKGHARITLEMLAALAASKRKSGGKVA